MNPFAVLELPERASLADAEVEQRFVELSARFHPDQKGAGPQDRQRFTDLNTAYGQLRTSGQRLKALLQQRSPEGFALKGSVPQALLSLFADIGRTLQEADAFLKDRARATTELSQALLAPRLLRTQKCLTEAQALISERQEALFASLPQMEQALDTEAQRQAAGRCCRELLYLEKWQSQIRDRFHQLL